MASPEMDLSFLDVDEEEGDPPSIAKARPPLDFLMLVDGNAPPSVDELPTLGATEGHDASGLPSTSNEQTLSTDAVAFGAPNPGRGSSRSSFPFFLNFDFFFSLFICNHQPKLGANGPPRSFFRIGLSSLC